MSDRLTTARTDLIHEMFDLFAPDNLVLESEAGDLLDRYAARAVDDALSVERVREVLHRGGWGVPSGCIQYTFTTALDGVTSIREDTTADTCEHASIHSTFAADLVAHLRGTDHE